MIPFTSTLKRAVETEPTEIPMLIGGEWRTASEAYEVRDPYRGTVVARAPRSSMKDLDDALNATVKAKAKVGRAHGVVHSIGWPLAVERR